MKYSSNNALPRELSAKQSWSLLLLLLTAVLSADPARAGSSSSTPAATPWTISTDPASASANSSIVYGIPNDQAVANIYITPTDTATSFSFWNPRNATPNSGGNSNWNSNVTVLGYILSGTSTVNVSNSAGNNTYSNPPYSAGNFFTFNTSTAAYSFLGSGTTDPNTGYNTMPNYMIGPEILIYSDADITLNAPTTAAGRNYSYANTYGIFTESLGAPAYYSQTKDITTASAAGADAGSTSITNGGTITANNTTLAPGIIGLFGYSLGGEGTQYPNQKDIVGAGGDGGGVNIYNNAGAQIILQGSTSSSGGIENTSAAIYAKSVGGLPGAYLPENHAYVGASGVGGPIVVQQAGSITSTVNGNSVGIFAESIGAAGGMTNNGTNGGISGAGGPVTITNEASGSISMNSDNSIGIIAASAIGAANNNFATASNVTSGAVTVDNYGSISTSGSLFNIGVLAVSTGSASILDPFTESVLATGGSGNSGSVSVTNTGTIDTNGQMAIGIAALSIGGAGIATTASPSAADNYLGSTAQTNANASGGAVDVCNEGTITTIGASAFGIVATSAGAGGISNLYSSASAANGNGLVVGGKANSNNPGGTVTVANSGSIITGNKSGNGNAAIGIIAQSIGGGGGSAGGTGAAWNVGDAGGGGGNGGGVNIGNWDGGSILTYGDGALGILAQSIGGGGGNGANAKGIAVAVGGTGGAGGNGGGMSITNGGISGTTVIPGSINTFGDFALGLVAQSIGGGGGNGGYSKAKGVFATSAIGGTGGSGGNGGTVDFTNYGSITTAGAQSHGILEQSIGGGGGNGGAANSEGAGLVFNVSLALGGSGSAGGNGGNVNFTNYHNVTTTGVDSIGILTQSIGGGGGNGGSSMAKSLALTIPDVVPVAISVPFSLGGNASNGGGGGAVTISNVGQTLTIGDGGHGIMAQSIGGGGGNGGDSTAGAAAIEAEGLAIDLDVALGGSGGLGGNGGAVTINNDSADTAVPGATSSTSTYGNSAVAIMAQSIGGGGGSSTAGNAYSPNVGINTGIGIGLNLALGATAGKGGAGGAATVYNQQGNTIFTFGSGSHGILAQSIAGGGGFAGGGAGGGSGNTINLNATVGGNAGAAYPSGIVTVQNAGNITTSWADSVGILAQSIGGGGGVAGSTDASAPQTKIQTADDAVNTVTRNLTNLSPSNSYTANVAVGGQGGAGGNANTTTITNSGIISTAGERAYGIEAQSIGGGGGNGGSASTSSSSSYSAQVTMGRKGGAGGNGAAVSVTNTGTIQTAGFNAYGILAQSIGGGGGVGGDGSVVNNSQTLGLGAAVVGNGASAGTGGSVTVNATGGSITTLGIDAAGILAQSIGGGGGVASTGCADSTGSASCSNSAASSSSSGSTYAATVTVGGKGSSGDNGGAVTVGNSGTISTLGMRSYGIEAQSIGGGGGNGSSTSSTSSGSSDSSSDNTYAANIGLGGQGGGSGNGGTVSVTNSGIIQTAGFSAYGILAQSIGGGGGVGGDGSYVTSTTMGLGAGIDANSGSSGYGADVTVTTDTGSSITTLGDNAAGMLAQSIGGGGGVASAGCTNPDSAGTASGNATACSKNTAATATSTSTYSASIAVGGNGSAAGNSGAVTLTNNGTINTQGMRAYGIEAQSIGGGGGNGTSASSSSSSDGSSSDSAYSANVSVAGTGGAAGNGGSVTVTSSNAIETAGYNAHGILAQSIGGGGGVGGDGSVAADTTIGLGAAKNANSGNGGSGNGVNVTTNSGGTITTLGDDAAGILAQSIGGGGGTATAGCTNSGIAGIAAGNPTACFGNTRISGSGHAYTFNPDADYTLQVGGNTGSNGNAGQINISVGDAITTYGARSMGIIAQSIGGGGGYATGASTNLAGTSLSSSGASNTTGGMIDITLAATAGITTHGAGSWGIFAQSIGGGGGFAGDPSLNLMTPIANNLNSGSSSLGSSANTINLNIDGNIATTGANAHGIVAQSLGGGGGIYGGYGNSADVALWTGLSATSDGNGNQITIDQASTSTIKTTGTGSIGIYAQVSGDNFVTGNNYLYPINITIGGSVLGGTNNGYNFNNNSVGAAGILLSGGGLAGHSYQNVLTVNAGGSISTVDNISGTAINSIDNTTNVQNSGIITGNILLGTNPDTAGTITNNAGGVLNTGATLTAATVNNAGTINPGGMGNIATTTVTGNYSQTGSGILNVDLKGAAAQQADLLKVSGNATIAGQIIPTITHLLSGNYKILTANSTTHTADTPSTLLYNWNLTTNANSLNLSPQADFMPSQVALTSNQRSIAGSLQSIWNNSAYSANTADISNPNIATLGSVFNQFYRANAGNYPAMLNALSSKANTFQGQQASEYGLASASGVMSCPGFTERGALLQERECVWGKFMGKSLNMDTQGSDANGYKGETIGFGFGGQKEFVKDWFLGGSMSYDNSSYSYADNYESGKLNAVSGALALKHQIGALQLGASVAYGHNWSENSRVVRLGNLPASTFTSAPDGNYVAGQLRGSYELMFNQWYMRPTLDVGILGLMRDGYTENGSGRLGLKVDAINQSMFYVTPSVDFGMRWDVGEHLLVRPFANVGYTKLTSSDITTKSRLQALPGSPGFVTKSPTLDNMARFSLGADILKDNNMELKIQYILNANGSYTDQGGAIKFGFYF